MKVAFNNLNNINFQKRFVIVGEKEQLKRADKQIKDSFVSSETLLVDNNDENALIIASDSDMTRLKMAKKRDDLGVWISKIQSLAGKNYLPALLNFLFGTNEKTALIDLDNLKGKKAVQFLEEAPIDGKVYYTDGSIMTYKSGNLISKKMPDSSIEFYDYKGRVNKISYPDDTFKKIFYEQYGDKKLFSVLPNGEVESEGGFVDYEDKKVTKLAYNGAVYEYDFNGTVVSITHKDGEKVCYDENGRPISHEFPDHIKVFYEPDKGEVKRFVFEDSFME